MDGRIAILKHSHGPWEIERYALPDPEPGRSWVGSIVPGFAFPLDPLVACQRGLRFIAFFQYDTRLLPRALNFVERTRQRVPWDRVVSHTFPLEGIQEAFERAEWVGRDPNEAVITRPAITP